jgi:hypothetical protein
MDKKCLNQSEIPGSFPTKALAVRRALEIHQGWLEQQLGVPLSDAVILEVEQDLTQIATERVLGVGDLESIPTRTVRRLRTLVADVKVPPGLPPVLRVDDGSMRDDLSYILGGPKRRKNPNLEWGDSPIALRFHLRGTVLIAINVPYFDGPVASYESTARLVVARRDRAGEAIRLLAWIARKDQQPRILVQDGAARRITPCDWDDLVLDQNVLSLKEDLNHWFERRAWFRKNKLPWRRGILCWGPPGNGKTSVVRAILSSHGLTAYTLPWFSPHKDDGDLDRLFEDAAKNCPSLILLEDLDRAFPKTGESKNHLSLQALLGCLDGLGTGDGIIVVATANDPTLLDPAILRRPGRFDRVIYFANPNGELRLKYLRQFNPRVDANKMRQAVIESEGFSFAYLKEAFVVAGQAAFQRNDDINADDLLHAVRKLRQANVQASEGSKSAGFGSTR